MKLPEKLKAEIMEGVQFLHVRKKRRHTIPAHNGKPAREVAVDDGVVTIALCKSGGMWGASFSCCSPDDQFCRADGRFRAARKLHFGQERDRRTGRHKETVATTPDTGCKFPEVYAIDLFATAITARLVPEWVWDWTIAVKDGRLEVL